MRNTRNILSLGLTAILAVSLTAGSAFAADDTVYRTLDEIKESGTINIGVFSVADRIVFFDQGDIVEETTDVAGFFEEPSTERARRFLKTFAYE